MPPPQHEVLRVVAEAAAEEVEAARVARALRDADRHLDVGAGARREAVGEAVCQPALAEPYELRLEVGGLVEDRRVVEQPDALTVLGVQAITADRAWVGLDLGVEVVVVRGSW